MQTSDMIVKGPVLHLNEQRNDRNQVIGYSLQLMKKGRKGFDVLKVRLPDGSKPEDYKEGMMVELAVDLSVYEGQVFYRATRDLRHDPKPETTARPATPTVAAKS